MQKSKEAGKQKPPQKMPKTEKKQKNGPPF